MNILIAPNSMKGSLNAVEFADTVEKAFLNCSRKFKIRKVPVADGGDFTGEILKRALNARDVQLQVKGPLGEKVNAVYAVSGKTAIIEMAGASGIQLIKTEQLNPMNASTFGTGQLILDAVKKGCNNILLGIGGSATVDGGSGMTEALGFQLLNKNDEKLSGNGRNLAFIKKIKTPDLNHDITFKIISDVNNPLLGKNGAAKIFGPQKGADDEMVNQLEKGLKDWADLLEKESGKKLADHEGAGAAGGIAVPLMAFFNAEIVPGADFILSRLNFEEHLEWCDIVITGEGKIDGQTLNTKAPMAVARAARNRQKPVFAFGGTVYKEASEIFDGIFSILSEPVSLEKAMENSGELLFDFSYQFANMLYQLKLKHD
ncbi:MAG: glycerate kinase [Prolixibacteraceae bacterium]